MMVMKRFNKNSNFYFYIQCKEHLIIEISSIDIIRDMPSDKNTCV